MEWEMTCALCFISGKDRATGRLLKHKDLTVHKKCLLYSSGLYCHNSQHSEDHERLLGFSPKDVKKEISRGSKLACQLCKGKGATVGCEVKRCKKSYHYPCALKDHATRVEDITTGIYKMYCQKHDPAFKDSDNSKDNSRDNSRASTPSSSKAGRPSLNGKSDNPTNGTSSKRKQDASETPNGMACIALARPPAHASDSDTRHRHTSNENPIASYTDVEAWRRANMSPDKSTPMPTPKSSSKKRRHNHSDSGLRQRPVSEDGEGSGIYGAPLETDFEDSGPSQKMVTPPPTPFHRKCKNAKTQVSPVAEMKHEEALDDSDGDSESLLLPLMTVMLPTTVLSASSGDGAATGSPVDSVPDLHNIATPAHAPRPTPPLPPLPQVRGTGSDSADFWKNCNKAGCTTAIFDDFIADMTELSRKIQTDQASQEDYDVSLAVLKASGKLTTLVAQQGKERERKLNEAEESLVAMKKAWSIVMR